MLQIKKQHEGEKALFENGYQTTPKGTQNNVVIYQKDGGNTKIVRDNASSTGSPTIETRNEKNTIIKKLD